MFAVWIPVMGNFATAGENGIPIPHAFFSNEFYGERSALHASIVSCLADLAFYLVFVQIMPA
jgi:hypothetical protein